MTEKSFQTPTYIFVFTFSCTTSSIVILSMFSRLFLTAPSWSEKRCKVTTNFWTDKIFRSFFWNFFISVFADALAPLLKSECKVTPFVLSNQIFWQLFFHYFLAFLPTSLCINYLHYENFYVVKHIFMAVFSIPLLFYLIFLRFFFCFVCYSL